MEGDGQMVNGMFPPNSEIGQEIKKSQQLIVQYKEELKKSRVIRRHRQEYDAMAKVVSRHLWRRYQVT